MASPQVLAQPTLVKQKALSLLGAWVRQVSNSLITNTLAIIAAASKPLWAEVASFVDYKTDDSCAPALAFLSWVKEGEKTNEFIALFEAPAVMKASNTVQLLETVMRAGSYMKAGTKSPD